MSTIRSTLVCGFFVSVLSTANVSAETWPGFRGVAGNGVSHDSNLPVEWSEEKNLAWKIELSGRGNSSPAVTSDRIYITEQQKDSSLHVLAINRADGNTVWDVKVGDGALSTFGPKRLYAHRHNPATPSPAADEKHVWAFFGTGLLVCLDRNGKPQWQRNLAVDYGDYNVRFGMATSPRLWGDLIYLACMHKGPSYIVALNKLSGEEVWKTDRQLPAKKDGPDAYSSPVVLQTAQRNELVVAGSDHIDSYDLKNGKQLWVSSGLTIDSEYGRVIASPAVSENIVVATSAHPLAGGMGFSIAIRTGGSGEITKSHRAWKFDRYTPDSPTPVCYNGRVYMIRDDGIGVCLDLTTGGVHWRKRISSGPFRASTVAGDGKIYFLHLDGVCTVVEAGEEGKILAKNKLPGTFYASPAISDGTIYLRGHHQLYAVGSR